jgi:glycosidase
MMKRRAPMLALCLALCNLAGCGGGGSTPPAPVPAPAPAPTLPTTHEVNILKAVGGIEQRLACNGAVARPACQLRIYQVMVESFVDGDPLANFNVGYGSSPHKGDLAGITASLDYIRSTGANALWLTPIFLSTPIAGQDLAASRLDATGYFASDYFQIDPRFGTLAQARTLVNEAHKRGIAVLFDGVFGHHKTNVVASPGGLKPFGGHDPVDYTHPDTLAFYREVAAYWIDQLQIDGWRLDQAHQVPPAAWASLRDTVQQASARNSYLNADGASVRPAGYLVAEVWKGETEIAASAYGSAAAPALASAFDFPLRYRLVQTLAAEESGLSGQSASVLAAGFATHAAYPDHAMPNLMLGNHDLVRFGDLIQRAGLGNPDGADYWARHKAAYTFMAAFSGPITLYYGEEIGQEMPSFAAKVNVNCVDAGLCDDHVSRDAGVVDGVAGPALSTAQRDLKNHVAALMRVRAANPALYSGARTHVWSDTNVYIDRKDSGANRVLLLLNVKTKAATVTLDSTVVSGAASLTDLITDGTIAVDAGGKFVITLAPLSGRLLRF